jgi:arabinofuranosyltransferase
LRGWREKSRRGSNPLFRTRHFDSWKGALPPLFLFTVALVAAGVRDGWNLVDDALILCRYAENVARGFGPVFNAGQPVEGHSSPLWVALLSPGGRIGMDLPYLARALGVLCGAALVISTSAVFHRLFPPLVASLLAGVVAADQGIAVWSLSGLETTGFALLVFLGVAVLWSLAEGEADDDPVRGGALLLGGLAGLLALARPEGLAIGAILVLATAALPRGGSRRGEFLLKAGAPFLGVCLALLAWRLSFYGAALPLTVTAKWVPRGDAFAEGARQAALFGARRLPLVAAAVLALRHLRGAGGWRVPLIATAAIVALLLVEVVAAGGDWMGHDRLPLPAVPLLALLAGAWLCGVGAAARPILLGVAGAVALSGTWLAPDRIPGHGRAARELGEWLRARENEETVLGVAAAGAVPFYSGLVTVDALGITDPAVARMKPPPGAAWKPGHMRYDLDRFLAARPDIVAWEFGTAWTGARLREPAGEPERRGDYRRELLASAAFRGRYRLLKAPPEVERYFSVFQRIDGENPRPD